jgi:purine catabolism regulator
MPLTLREALTMAEPLRKARVVAGEQGLDNVVRSVNVMEVPDILDWVRPGELLVTTMYPLHDDAAEIETLVPRLAEKGLAGLAVTPLGYIDELPQCMIDAANKLGFPLIELPPRVSFIDIIQPLTTAILNLQANEILLSERILRQFIDLVLSGGSYSEIAQVIAQVVQCPVSIVDRFRRVLGNASPVGGEQVQKRFIRKDEAGDSYLSELYKPELVEMLPGNEAKHMRVSGPEGPIDHIVCPITVSSMTLGEIIVWGLLPYPLRSTDLIAVQHGATVAALKMMEMRSLAEVKERFRNEILEGLLSDRPADLERAAELSRELGDRLNPPFVIILVEPDLPSEMVLAKGESVEQSNVSLSLQLARRYIHFIEPRASFWHQGARLVVFFPLQARRLAEAKAFLVQELRKVCKRIGVENAPYTVSVGISSPASDLAGFRQAYECARQSLVMGRAFRGQPSGVVTCYEDLGLLRVISPAESPSSLERFCLDTIEPLITHDRERGTELVKTLRVFLEHNQNSASAAKALHIHYNTLRYRLDRIKKLLGDALDNPQQRLTIEVALQLYPLIVRSHPKL